MPAPSLATPRPRTSLASLHALVGRTPLLVLHVRFRGREVCVGAKHESANLTGSIKDRMALGILEEAYAQGELREGDTIVEATSGNTGIAFAALGRLLGHPVRIYMPEWMSRERRDLLESLGAEVFLVSREEGGFRGSIERADRWATEHGRAFLPHQFERAANADTHHRTTGPELLTQLRSQGLEPAAFVAGVGTGGTVSGAGRYLRERVPGIAVHPLEPSNSPTLRTGTQIGRHRIQGISDEFVPPLVHLDELDDILDVDDGDAIRMAQRLARELGLGVGISSGANLLGALLAAERGNGEVVGTVFPDSNAKYLSTDLFQSEPALSGHCTDEVEFLGLEVISGCTCRTPPGLTGFGVEEPSQPES